MFWAWGRLWRKQAAGGAEAAGMCQDLAAAAAGLPGEGIYSSQGFQEYQEQVKWHNGTKRSWGLLQWGAGSNHKTEDVKSIGEGRENKDFTVECHW